MNTDKNKLLSTDVSVSFDDEINAELEKRKYVQHLDEFGEEAWDEGKLHWVKKGFIEGAKWVNKNKILKVNQEKDKDNEGLPQGSNLLTPRQVDDKFTKEWAEDLMFQYSRCSDAQILAWGYRLGYEEARKDLLSKKK